MMTWLGWMQECMQCHVVVNSYHYMELIKELIFLHELTNNNVKKQMHNRVMKYVLIIQISLFIQLNLIWSNPTIPDRSDKSKQTFKPSHDIILQGTQNSIFHHLLLFPWWSAISCYLMAIIIAHYFLILIWHQFHYLLCMIGKLWDNVMKLLCK